MELGLEKKSSPLLSANSKGEDADRLGLESFSLYYIVVLRGLFVKLLTIVLAWGFLSKLVFTILLCTF